MVATSIDFNEIFKACFQAYMNTYFSYSYGCRKDQNRQGCKKNLKTPVFNLKFIILRVAEITILLYFINFKF